MRLDERLRLLRGNLPETTPAPVGADLAERLQRLGSGARRPVPKPAPDEQSLAKCLGAERLAPGVLRVERRFPLTSRHGRVPLGDSVAALPPLMGEPAVDPAGWLFLDTETSGLSGGTGTWAFLTGLARFEGTGLQLRQYLLTRLDGEPDYLKALRAELEGAEVLVTYNGKCFDAPLLATRFRLAGLQSPLTDRPHLDLLAPVRVAFARVWPDCRLVTAEARLLGLRREGDLPGSEAPAAWLAWLRQGETVPLAGVLEHNRRDLLSLPALVPALERTLHEPGSMGADVCSVARHRLRQGDHTAALTLLEADRARLDDSGLLALARLHRRHGQWDAAVAIWESLAVRGQPEALEALAKQLEHRIGDYAGALALARRLPPGTEREWRCRRLEQRLGIPA